MNTHRLSVRYIPLTHALHQRTVRLSRDASRAGRRNPDSQRRINSAIPRRFFVSAAIRSMAAGSGHPSGWPVPLCRFSTPLSVRHHIGVETDLADSIITKEFEMSNTLKGAIRPTITLSRAAIEKRIRRLLSKEGLVLRNNRPGTIQFAEYGPVHVEEPKCRSIIKCRMTLEELALVYGVLEPHETLEAPQGFYCVMRIGGKKAIALSGWLKTKGEAEAILGALSDRAGAGIYWVREG